MPDEISTADAEAKLEAHRNLVVRKRKLTAQHPWEGEGNKEREKRRLEEEAERSAVNASQQCLYVALSEKELKISFLRIREGKPGNKTTSVSSIF